MITYRHGIIAHEVHHLDLQLAFEKVIIRGTLRDVSAIQQQHIRMLAAKLLYKTGTAHHTAHPGILVGSLGADGFYTAVRIAGVQDKQLFSGLAGRYRIGGHQAKGFFSNDTPLLLCRCGEHEKQQGCQGIHMFHRTSVFLMLTL